MESLDLLERCYPGRRAESKRCILRCALSLFNEQGIEATTIESIRAGSHTSVGTIYHHFRNKEGLVAALYKAALEDQAQLRCRYVGQASIAQELIQALVYSYIDWVVNQPNWASFLYQASQSASKDGLGEWLMQANRATSAQLADWLAATNRRQDFQVLPLELIPSLVIGPVECYCRAWLASNVKQSPITYREIFADAAWHSVAHRQPQLSAPTTPL